MNKKRMIGLTGAMSLVLFIVLLQAQEQKVTLRYKFNVGDTWKYECVLEGETDDATADFDNNGEMLSSSKHKYLRNIEENFSYKVLEITPEGYFKVNLETTPIESKGVNIDMKTGEKEEEYYSGAKYNYEEIVINLKGDVLTMSSVATNGTFANMKRRYATITNPLGMAYAEMIKLFHPVMPEGPVGISDTWIYQIELWRQFPTSLNYKLVGFGKQDDFDCAKIEYNYSVDFTDKANEMVAKKVKNRRFDALTVKGAGTIYFAYNENILISRKENLLRTEIESELVNEKWGIRHSRTERIGFTMNYIKPQ